jgi:hypothetical protein
LQIRYYRELIDAFHLPMAWNWSLRLAPEDVRRLAPGLDFLNVRFLVVDPAQIAAAGNLGAPVADADLAVYQRAGAAPRAFFVDRATVYDTVDELVQRINTGDGRPFAAVRPGTLSTAQSAAGQDTARTVLAATDYELRTNSTSFTITAPAPGVAVLSETFVEGGMAASINGQAAPVFRVNHAFRGVEIPAAGTYRIKIAYQPPHWNASLGLAALGLILIPAGAALFAWSDPRQQAGDRMRLDKVA